MTRERERRGFGMTTVRLELIVVAAALVIASRLLAWRLPSLRLVAICLIYSVAVGAMALVVCPWAARRGAPRSAAAQRLVTAVAPLLIALVGSVAGTGVILAVGLWPRTEAVALGTTGLGTSLLVLVPLYVYDAARARRARAERALREEAQRRQQTELLRERAERLAAEARLASLESRMPPHFLFNALNTITDVVPEDPARAEQLMVRFTRLLHACLRWTRSTVPLREELGVIDAYLEIEQARLGPRLRWHVRVPPELGEHAVPIFCVQSLVQNSIKHVAGSRPRGVEIRVEGHLSDGHLVLAVWDDGPGFALPEAPAGRGLDTLRTLLAARYGERGRLEVHRAAGGTRVEVWLPVAPVPEHDESPWKISTG